jgi:hypothetical protein
LIALQTDVARRVLYILHSGLVEARNLAMSGKTQQLFDLADALETLPGELNEWKEDSLESIRFNLRTYQDRYRGQSNDHLKYLDREEPPDRF